MEEELESTISDDIEFWLPYIILNKVDIIRKVDDYSFFLSISFSVTETGANREIIVFVTPNNITIDESESDNIQTATVSSNFSGGY